MTRSLTTLASLLTLLALLAAGCSSPSPASTPTAYRLDGIWGGVMNHAGTDFGIFAMDVETTLNGSSGTVSGVGVLRNESADVLVDVTGATSPGSVDLTLTDAVNDTIRLSGTVEGPVIRGSWSYPSAAVSGSMRMTREENVDLLSAAWGGGAATLADLF